VNASSNAFMQNPRHRFAGRRGHGSERKPSSVPFPHLTGGRGMVICLGWPSPATSSSLPAAAASLVAPQLVGVGHTSPPIWPCSDWGLPCPLAYARGGGLLPHHFTLTPALRPGRFVFCGPSVASRRPGVTWQSTRWSSDFPRRNSRPPATIASYPPSQNRPAPMPQPVSRKTGITRSIFRFRSG